MGARKLTYVRLHEAYGQPGASGLGNLPKTLGADQKGIEMFWTPEGIEVKYKGAHFIVPLANVVGATFAKEEPPK